MKGYVLRGFTLHMGLCLSRGFIRVAARLMVCACVFYYFFWFAWVLMVCAFFISLPLPLPLVVSLLVDKNLCP